MSLTVREALSMEVFQEAQVVAGHSGLGRSITWVNILEVLDEIDLLQEGDLLVTTAFGLTESTEGSQTLMARFAARNLAGLAIQTGYYLHEIPEFLIQQANECGLPLILLPKNLAFTDLTKAVLRRIVSRQLELLEFSDRMHRELTQIVLDNQGLDKLALVLAELLHRTIFIFDRELRYEASSDPHLEQNIKNLPEAFSNPRQNLISVPFSPLCRLEGTKATPALLLHPIRAGRKTYGYIAVLEKGDLQEQETIALSQAATVSALVMLKDLAVSEAEARIRGDFLDDLLGGSLLSEEALLRSAAATGFKVNLSYSLAVISLDGFLNESTEPTALGPTEFTHTLSRKLLTDVNRLLSNREHHPLTKVKGDMVVLLLQPLPGEAPDFYQPVLQSLHSELKKALQGLPISIGVSRPSASLRDIPRSYAEASKSLHIARVIWKQNTLAFYSDLGIYRLLLSAEQEELRTLYEETTLPLVDMDKNHKTELVRTAEVYLLTPGNLKEAAAALYIHRHTLRYRLQRLESILGLDLNDAEQRLRLQLGLMARHLL